MSAMQVNLLEEKMAGNSRDQNIAFQAAESTLREAETYILSNPVNTTYTGLNGLLNFSDLEPTNFFTYSWAANNSQEASNPNSTFELVSNPRFVIKKISQNGAKTYFKITARAVGRSAGTQIILQEYFVRNN
jgi:type IV pilus assembly protein PilX